MATKNLFLALMASAGLIMASCSSEDLPNPAANDDGNVVFTAKMPAGIVNSRAFADGTQATELKYAVYDSGTTTVIFSSDQTDAPVATYNSDQTFTLSLNLVKGQTYDLVFWAQTPDNAAYTFDPATQSISVDYSDITCNAEGRDAFFTAVKSMTVTGAMNKSVQLYRPFAQLNIGTNDIAVAERANIILGTTQVTVKDVYTALNLFTGVASQPEDVVYGHAERPAGETFPVNSDTYDYLSMNYVLTGSMLEDEDVNSAQKETKDITIDIKANDGRDVNTFNVSAVPFQRNYRTNIYGTLLTSTVDLTIEIKPGFAGDDENIDYDAILADGVVYDAATKTYTLYSANALQWFNDQTNVSKNSFKDYTVKLGANIDLDGVKWTPLSSVDNYAFQGTFDGDGYTVSNMTTSATKKVSAGFFAANMGLVKNLTLTNVNVSGNYKAGAVSGDGLCGKFENCTVDGGIIVSTPHKLATGIYDDANNVGGIVGYLSAESNAHVKDCTVKNLKIYAYRTIGSIVGSVGGVNCVVSGNTALDCELVSNMLITNYDGYPRQPETNALFGRFVNSAVEGENNSSTNISIAVIKEDENTSNEFKVSTGLELEAISMAVLNGAQLKNKTITLTGDVDATGFTMESKWDNGNFAGATFDGGGYTISNLTIVGGMFPAGAIAGSTVKNISFKNCKVVQGTLGSGSGLLFAQTYSTNVVIENVHADGCTIEGNFAVGGLIGQLTAEEGNSSASFKNCSVTNTKFTAFGNSKGAWIESVGIGGANAFVGCAASWWHTATVTLEDCTASGNTFTNDASVVGGGLYFTAKLQTEKTDPEQPYGSVLEGKLITE